VTDYGKIYRSSTDDGAFSLWAFGSTSAFDTALNIDSEFFADPNHLPIAVFKFQSLSLIGNPIIDTSNGGVTNLGLIGVDGITSGPPGGTLTFTGLDLLVLATVNGSINLTSDVSFQDLNGLAMYARGAGSDLTIDSPISNIGTLDLAAEGSIQLTNPGTMSAGAFEATAGNNLTLQIGGSLLLNGRVRLHTLVLPGTTITNGANLTLDVTGDYTNNSATEFSLLHVTNQGAHIGTGGNIAVNIGGNLTATGLGSATEFPEPGDFEAVVQNTNGLIDNGGNLNLTVNGNVQVNGLVAYVQNYDETANAAGHIGVGGNVDIEISGNLTANSYVDVFLNNRGGGMIDSGGNLTFNVGGALTIGADAGGGAPDFSAEFVVSTRYDDIMGNTTPSFIGSDVSLFMHAASVDMAGGLFGSGISNRGGSVIDGNATATWDVPGDVNIKGTAENNASGIAGASWWILNDIPPDVVVPPSGGGTIHGNATVTLNIGGDLTVAGDGSIFIANQRNFQAIAPIGGTIDSDATLNISAANFSVGGVLDVEIDNFISGSSSGTGGSIGGNAAINLNLFGNLIATGSDPNSGGIPGDAYFQILNHSSVSGSPGGFIGGDATIDLNIINASIAGLFDVEIDNHNGGTIGGNATIDVSAANVTANSLLAQIDNTGGTIGGNASVNVGVSGNINIVGDASFQILNNDGGHIGTGGNISVTTGAGGDFTANSVIAFVNNHNGGTIDSGANITFNIGGALTTTGDAIFVVSNLNDGTGGGTIGSLATVDINAASISVGGFFQTFSGANGGGSIQGDAINTVTTSGDLTAQQGILLNIADTAFGSNGVFTGGHIGGNAIVTLSAQNIITPSTATGVPGTDTIALEASIYSDASGTVGGDALVNVSATQDISAPGTVFFSVANGNFMGLGPGTIGGDAKVNVMAANLSTGALFDDIYNYGGGSIGRDAIISLNLSNSFTATGNARFLILSFGGIITRNALIDLTAGDISAPSLTAIINNSSAGLIGGDATINLSTASLSVGSAADVTINNSNGGTIGGSATINMNVSGTDVAIYNSNGGMIGGNATINVSTGNISVGGALNVGINNDDGGIAGGGGTIGGNATVNVSATNFTASSLFSGIFNSGGSIGASADVAFNLTGDLTTTQGSAEFSIFNNNDGSGSGGGTITGDATVDVNVGNLTSAPNGDFHALIVQIDNWGGDIQGNAIADFAASGNVDAQGNALFQIYNFNDGGSDGGTINGNAVVNVSAVNISTLGFFYSAIGNDDNGNAGGGGAIVGDATVNVSAANITAASLTDQIVNQGGSIGSSANVMLNLSGDLTTQGDAVFQILNYDNGSGSGGGSIGGNATINVSAANISSTQGGAFFNIVNDNGGMIGGNATISANIADVSLAGALVEVISNSGGNIVGNAGLTATAGTVTLGTTDLNVGIGNGSGSIGGNASISFDASGDINQTNGNTFFQILNNQTGDVAASIGQDATVTVSGANILTSDQLFVAVDNTGGGIGGEAMIDFTAIGDISGNNTFFLISNSGGTIGSDATITLNATNITAGSLLAQIDNSNGTISGNAAINMNVSGSASVTNDATVAIYGSDGPASAAINFNGGSYDAGGTFSVFTDGNGTITFNNASLHADVLKVGALGTNGVLNIGGGTLSADTTLKLYAGGSNGTINFKADVTLGGNAATKILAANSITIFNNVTVTIGGSTPADVYTTNANYSALFGGNGSTTGTFAGAGANDPQPLSSAPAFDDPPPPAGVTTTSTSTRTAAKGPTLSTTSSTTGTKSGSTLSSPKPTSTKTGGPAINVSNTDQLLSLLDGAATGSDGKITISNSKSGNSNSKNTSSNSTNLGRINASGVLHAHRQMMDIRQMRDRSVMNSRLDGGARPQ
jgi:hypothetical protein